MHEEYVENEHESLRISSDERHGKAGFRVTRYTPSKDPDVWNWDESYQFYESLDAARSALGNEDVQDAAKKAF